MLPPLTIATTGPSPRRLVQRAAAHGRDGGGAARFGDDLGVEKRPPDGLDDLVVFDRDHGVDVRLNVRERRDRPGRTGMRPSATLCVFGSVTGCPASSDAFIAAAPAGSTPMTRTAGFDCLIAAATPATRPPPPIGTSDRRDVGTLFEDLEAGRPLSRDDPLMIERGHHRQAACGRFGFRARAAIGGRRALEDHFRTECPGASTLIDGAVVGMTTTAGAPSSPRRERHRLAVVARGVGDDAAAPLVVGELRDHVVGAADLERPARLQALALQPERRPARPSRRRRAASRARSA